MVVGRCGLVAVGAADCGTRVWANADGAKIHIATQKPAIRRGGRLNRDANCEWGISNRRKEGGSLKLRQGNPEPTTEEREWPLGASILGSTRHPLRRATAQVSHLEPANLAEGYHSGSLRETTDRGGDQRGEGIQV